VSNSVVKGQERGYLQKIVDEFDRNKKQIESQTKDMQNIQSRVNQLLAPVPALKLGEARV